jgi:hypothetical protein
VTLPAAANTATINARAAIATIGGQAISVGQPGATPKFTISPSIKGEGPFGGFGTITLTAIPEDQGRDRRATQN